MIDIGRLDLFRQYPCVGLVNERRHCVVSGRLGLRIGLDSQKGLHLIDAFTAL